MWFLGTERSSKTGLGGWTVKLRNPGQKKGPFPGTSCAALDKPLNLSELLFSHWEIRKIIIIIIIPKVMTVMKVQIINVTVLSLISNNTGSKTLHLHYFHCHDFRFPTNKLLRQSFNIKPTYQFLISHLWPQVHHVHALVLVHRRKARKDYYFNISQTFMYVDCKL